MLLAFVMVIAMIPDMGVAARTKTGIEGNQIAGDEDPYTPYAPEVDEDTDGSLWVSLLSKNAEKIRYTTDGSDPCKSENKKECEGEETKIEIKVKNRMPEIKFIRAVAMRENKYSEVANFLITENSADLANGLSLDIKDGPTVKLDKQSDYTRKDDLQIIKNAKGELSSEKITMDVIVLAKKTISEVNITGFKAPSAGKELVSEISSDTTGILSTQIEWKKDEDKVSGKAEYNSTYTAKIEVKADSKYKFAEKVNVKLDGKTIEGTLSDEGIISIEQKYTTERAKLYHIIPPQNVEVQHGASRDVKGLNLPEKVTIVTEDKNVTTAEVTWNVDELTNEDYDQNKLEEQNFEVEGKVRVPDNINAGEMDCDIRINVKVSAAERVKKPSATVKLESCTEGLSVELKTGTEGATIYYTTNGTEPSKENGTKYNEKIPVSGTNGSSKEITIKAIAVKDKMRDSEVAEFTYVIALPAIEIKEVKVNGIDQPEVGKKFDTEAYSDTVGLASGFNISEVTWTKADGGKVTTAEKYNTVYKASVTLSPDIGYTFKSDITATINGEKAVVNSNEDGSITLTFDFKTVKAKLISIIPPANINAKHGTAKRAEALGLPDKVKVSVEGNGITEAKVTWDLNNLVSGSYDVKKDGVQTFVVNGSVDIPKDYVTNGKSTNVQVTINVDNVHEWETETKKRTIEEDGYIKTYCRYCAHEKKRTVIPRKELELEWGKTHKLDKVLDSISGYESMTVKNASEYKKYFSVNSKKGSITVQTTDKVKIKKSIPIKIAVSGKSYDVNVKIKIPAPDKKNNNLKIKRTSVGKMYKYKFTYNIKDKNATRILVTCDDLNNKVLKKYIKGKKSTSDSYIYCSKKTVNKNKNKKLKFKIKIIYGKNQSKELTMYK